MRNEKRELQLKKSLYKLLPLIQILLTKNFQNLGKCPFQGALLLYCGDDSNNNNKNIIIIIIVVVGIVLWRLVRHARHRRFFGASYMLETLSSAYQFTSSVESSLPLEKLAWNEQLRRLSYTFVDSTL